MKTRLLSLFVALVATTAPWASNVISYTATEKLPEVTTDGWAIGLHTNAFNVAITSHEFSNGTGTITFAGEVTIIGYEAFTVCEGLTSITIPNSVTTIGEGAFSICKSLTFIQIPNSVTSIGGSAFYYCSSLTSITIPNSVTEIGSSAFSGCTGLTSIEIPNSVTAIGKEAFYMVNNIVYSGIATGSPWDAKCVNGYVDGYLVYSDATQTTLCGCSTAAKGEISIPNSVTTIGDYAFYDCSALTSVTIPNSVTTIGNGAFTGCSALTSVTIPNSVTTIGNGAFTGCSSLTSPLYNATIFAYMPESYSGAYTIPDGIKQIAGGAFEDCSSLTSITIPNSVTSIGNSAFSGCTGLTSITIPNSVTTIGGWAFYYCSSLTSITIPNSVTTIGNSAFSGCTGLTSVTIGNSVTTIGEQAFWGCYSLTKTNFTGTIADWCKIEFLDVYSNPINNSHNFFIHDVEVKDLIIPEGVNAIGDYTFVNCDNLTSVTIPNSVTTIGEGAFWDCEGLTSITIPNSVTTIGEGAFWDCEGLTSVTWNAKNCNGCAFGNQVETFIFGNEVETIPSGLCRWMNKLTSITIPNSVTTIGEEAFYKCEGLTSITCYAQNPPRCGDNCFRYVPKDIPLYIPYNASLSAYQSAEGWKDFTNIITKYFDICGEDLRWKYEEGTLSISGTGEMSDFTQTDSPWLDLKDSVTNIVFPSNITSIGKYAFYGFSKLTSVTTPNAITTIGESAFENCTYLKTITLGKSLTDIGCKAFKGDFRIEEITSYAEVTPNVCSSTFDGLSKQYIYLYVPENSIRGYQVDPNWNEFDIRTKAAEKKPIDGDNPIVTPSDQDVTITWPITDGSDTYTLTITKNGEVVCVLTFNANGQLTNIAFAAPSHNGARQAPAATLTAQGYQFTVTGLNPGTAYDYSVTATDAGGKTLAEHKGNFSTTGGTPTSINEMHSSQPTMHKVLRDGQILLERNNATYTLMGQKVK